MDLITTVAFLGCGLPIRIYGDINANFSVAFPGKQEGSGRKAG